MSASLDALWKEVFDGLDPRDPQYAVTVVEDLLTSG